MARPEGKDRGLFERPKDSGVWWIRWADRFGKEYREKAGTKSAARSLYQARKAAVLQGQKLPELGRRPLLVSDIIDRYLPEFVTNKKNADDDVRIAKLWKSEIGSIAVESLQPGDVEKVKSKWSAEFAPATVNRRLAFLKTVFNRAVRDELTERNPLGSQRVKMMRENPEEKPIITPEQELAILEKLSIDDQRAVLFSLHTGLRISEQLGAKRSHLNLKRGLLMLPDPKAGKRQEVYLNPVALAIATELLQGPKSEWLFSQNEGKEPIERDRLSRTFSAVAAELGYTNLVYHCLRHTFISRLVMLGVPIVTVQKLARHKDITMTLRYAHLYPLHTAEAVANLAKEYPDSRPTGTKTGTRKTTSLKEPSLIAS